MVDESKPDPSPPSKSKWFSLTIEELIRILKIKEEKKLGKEENA